MTNPCYKLSEIGRSCLELTQQNTEPYAQVYKSQWKSGKTISKMNPIYARFRNECLRSLCPHIFLLLFHPLCVPSCLVQSAILAHFIFLCTALIRHLLMPFGLIVNELYVCSFCELHTHTHTRFILKNNGATRTPLYFNSKTNLAVIYNTTNWLCRRLFPFDKFYLCKAFDFIQTFFFRSKYLMLAVTKLKQNLCKR